ncbi:MAG: DUF2939 domain-containing protein [Hyphomicrobium sp.]|uniref:DUF2939 domain-containing protein n=1 Tax=Hyphomicrobium sp. TaxID=82 RepID=UPI003D107041
MAAARGTPVARLLKMRSFGTIGVLAVAAFYIAWPLYAGYEIKSSLDTQNVEGLNAHVDFPSVRISLKPAVTAKVEQVVTDALGRAGRAGGALAERLKAEILPRIVDGVLATLVTPEMMIRIHASGKSLKEALDGLVIEQASATQGFGGMLVVPPEGEAAGSQSKLEEIAGKLGIDTSKVFGGTVSKAAEPVVAPPPSSALPAVGDGKNRPKYGVGNIKHFSVSGPLALSIGVSRDASTRKPELTADLSFVDGSWKLTGLVPEP